MVSVVTASQRKPATDGLWVSMDMTVSSPERMASGVHGMEESGSRPRVSARPRSVPLGWRLVPARTPGKADPDTDRFRFVVLIPVEATEVVMTIVLVPRGHRLLFLVTP